MTFAHKIRGRDMTPWINANQVRLRVPEGCKLPAPFDEFVRAGPPFCVEWTELDDFGLKQSAMKEALPFLRLSDGGLVVLWYHAVEPAVVHLGSEGERKVVACDFDNFLKGVTARKSGVPDIDSGEQDFSVPGIDGGPDAAELPALQDRFDKWFKQHTSLLEPLATPAAEALRQRVHNIAEDMLEDGCSKVYTRSSSWWSMNFRIERDGDDLSITYLDFGKWYPVPDKYKLAEDVAALLTLVKNKEKRRYELLICCAGIVSIDGDRELLLVSPLCDLV
jgi:hypothetical protein